MNAAQPPRFLGCESSVQTQAARIFHLVEIRLIRTIARILKLQADFLSCCRHDLAELGRQKLQQVTVVQLRLLILFGVLCCSGLIKFLLP